VGVVDTYFTSVVSALLFYLFPCSSTMMYTGNGVCLILFFIGRILYALFLVTSFSLYSN
jgi:hypothetical protein